MKKTLSLCSVLLLSACASTVPVATAPAPVHAALPEDAADHAVDHAHAAPSVEAPARARPAAGAPFIARPTALQHAEPLLEYEIVERPVLDLFPKIAQDERAYLFDFTVPFVMWKGAQPHRRIPAKKNYQFNLPDLHAALYAMATGTVTNVVGPTGCGKTELVKQIAVRLNMPVTLVPMDGQITRTQLIGQRGLVSTEYGPQDVWRDGIIARSLLEPGIVLLDEVDRGVSDVQYAVHSVYTGEGLTLLDDGGRIVPMHKHNRVFTTANTKGRGSMDGLYQASEEMTEATRNRLTQWIEMDYQSKEEDEAVLKNEFESIDEEAVAMIASIAEQIRSAFKGQIMSQSCSMRDQLETARRHVFFARMTRDADKKKVILADCVRMIMANRASEQDKNTIESYIVSTIGTADSLFVDAPAATPAGAAPTA